MTLLSTDLAMVHAIGRCGGFLTALRGLSTIASTYFRFPQEDYTPALAQVSEAEREAAQMTPLTAVPVLIVGYANASDIVACLTALGRAHSEPGFEVFICENGGPQAYAELLAKLTAENGPCRDVGGDAVMDTPLLVARRMLSLQGETGETLVHLGLATENLGYAGGVNAWLRPLMAVPGWPAAWVLNPDTQPAPDALLELAAYAERWGKGMVGSRLVPTAAPDLVHSRGLHWCKARAVARAVDLHSPIDFEPDPQHVDSRIHAPSGASLYVTRACMERIGLMDERYFLFFEDLEWGIRAGQEFGVGYAHRSIVVHAGGTTIGSSTRTARQSPLSVYLEYRNSILFVRENFPAWLVWTIMVQLSRILLKSRAFPLGSSRAAFRGIFDGVRGCTGRPNDFLHNHKTTRGGTIEASP
jgi:N-acetylglucosaminyl-diphospho-decaprenol L-rhamnosyltransferase